MSDGVFVTLEGVEGSGKSIQLNRICELLEEKSIPFAATREPGGTDLGRQLRRILLQTDGAARLPMAEVLLYLADRVQHLNEFILPTLREGKLVLCDRYHDATLAYQGFARGIGVEKIDALAALLNIRAPDLTLVLDLDVEEGLRRARQRNLEQETTSMGRFEAESIEFHRKVRQGYLLLASREPRRIVVVDASAPPQVVFQSILSTLRQYEVLSR
ncbi:MAG TPA: dTMP kinase [Acidobacteriota bacterium]|nr:dTMP kinase [Acidobacteriota bacterium]